MNIRRSALALAPAVARRRLPTQLDFSIPIPPIVKQNTPQSPVPPPRSQYSALEIYRISELLRDPELRPGRDLEEALTAARINPSPNLLLEVFEHFDSTPQPLFTLFNWAQKHPDYPFSIAVFNAMVNSLGRAREFDSAWCLILDLIGGDPSKRPDSDTFIIMIRRYARADSLCKEGHVKIASRYFDKHRENNPNWLPSIRVYNVLLNGWFRSRKLKRADRLWEQMKKEDIVRPTVVTYGTLVEGLCRMGRSDEAMKLVDEMKKEGVEPNAIVYNAIIDALGEAGRFKEALGMLERFSILENGPGISTYNSLVKGFCKAGEPAEACKILRIMMDNRCMPTPTTYSYFFKYFSKAGMAGAGLNLYTKMINSGYEPDRVVYHQLVKMLCKEGKLDLVTQVIQEMRARGFDFDLAVSTMLIHLLWKMSRYDEAVFEFQDMFRRGIVPQQLTYQRMTEDLEKRGRAETAQKLHDLMASVPHSTNLPNTYKQFRYSTHERKTRILQRAEAMSDILKRCKNPRELAKHGNQSENTLITTAQKLMDNIQKKANLRSS
ncbi:pentatricopeptide repeat-containing protein At5g11310, mitochondrial isoform X2 [Andrographis paniculata]|uniref:pentatricopeptide repeat-containing protein At5g11310, mitochondrial isoform X2 n=1 Tax=Andrographis paniculata TaxID=175694 RepID=UPI0021E77657|nr:pentatricopeptide repeat-containing protein At5g11310, mitochondrial isoform X2 [Andrographis paniculata]